MTAADLAEVIAPGNRQTAAAVADRPKPRKALEIMADLVRENDAATELLVAELAETADMESVA